MKRPFAKNPEAVPDRSFASLLAMLPAASSSRFCVAGALLAMLTTMPWSAAPGYAHKRGMYATKAEAEQRSAELNCQGTFQMGNLWMPCANERALHNALQKSQ